MLGYHFKYRGQSFSDDEFDVPNGRGIVLQDLDWSKIVTDDDQSSRGADHGIEVSPTMYRGRLISIDGLIVANTRPERQIYRDIVMETFLLEPIPSPTNRGFYTFEFYDDDGVQWSCLAKVLNGPSFTQIEIGEIEFTKFEVQLVAEDPVLVGNQINQYNYVEGFYGGIQLPVQLPVQLDNYGYIANLINSGFWPSPLKITITVNGNTGPNMRVENIQNGTYFGVMTPLVDGDILIIDTKTSTVTLNGDDISGDRISGSIWQFLAPGNNEFVIRDDLTILGDGLSVDVLFEWYNTKV